MTPSVQDAEAAADAGLRGPGPGRRARPPHQLPGVHRRDAQPQLDREEQRQRHRGDIQP